MGDAATDRRALPPEVPRARFDVDEAQAAVEACENDPVVDGVAAVIAIRDRAMPDPDFVIQGDPTSNAPDLYASNHDMFAFMVAPDRVIDDGSEEGLYRGVIVDNSEVGGGSLGLCSFLYRYLDSSASEEEA